MMTQEVLLEKLNKFCPPWITRPTTHLGMAEMLESIIRQVLPGLLDIKIESIDADKITGTVPYQRTTANVVGYMHGGTIFTAGDTLAGAFLWFNSEPENYAVTVGSSIRYLKAFKDGHLRCTVTEKTRLGRKVTLEAVFTDSADNRISEMTLDYLLMTLPATT